MKRNYMYLYISNSNNTYKYFLNVQIIVKLNLEFLWRIAFMSLIVLQKNRRLLAIVLELHRF